MNSTRPSSTPTPTQAAGDSAAAMNSVSALVGLGAIVVGVTVMAL